MVLVCACLASDGDSDVLSRVALVTGWKREAYPLGRFAGPAAAAGIRYRAVRSR